MDKESFLKCVRKQLRQMQEVQKDAWILTNAKLLPESGQQDFLMSLSGEKMIQYMPTQREIEAFCEKVREGSIYMEYKNSYYEFDDEGRYIDNWIGKYYDLQKALPFLNRTLEGCHDLIQLGEYNLAGQILDNICPLVFQVEEAEDSQGDYRELSFTVLDADKEQMLSMKLRDIAYDWVLTFVPVVI